MINVIVGLSDPFDYGEYQQKCTADGIMVLPIGEFARQAGEVVVARRMFGGDMLQYRQEADRQHLALIQSMTHVAAELIPTAPAPCSGCGGGQVR